MLCVWIGKENSAFSESEIDFSDSASENVNTSQFSIRFVGKKEKETFSNNEEHSDAREKFGLNAKCLEKGKHKILTLITFAWYLTYCSVNCFSVCVSFSSQDCMEVSSDL